MNDIDDGYYLKPEDFQSENRPKYPWDKWDRSMSDTEKSLLRQIAARNRNEENRIRFVCDGLLRASEYANDFSVNDATVDLEKECVQYFNHHGEFLTVHTNGKMRYVPNSGG